MGFLKWLLGPKEKISKSTMKHATLGEFNTNNRLVSGGHSQRNINELEKRRQKFNIVKTYSNGVRVGNVENHKKIMKQVGTNQSWFPKHWNDIKIKHAAQVVARGPKLPDGHTKSGIYDNVNVGIIRTNSEISTIFPMSPQKNKKGVEMNEYRKIKRINKRK